MRSNSVFFMGGHVGGGCRHRRGDEGKKLPGGSPPTFPLVPQIEPLRGPLEGGTLLTIRGRNLGRRFSDVLGAVRIGSVQCAPLPDRYVVSEA